MQSVCSFLQKEDKTPKNAKDQPPLKRLYNKAIRQLKTGFQLRVLQIGTYNLNQLYSLQ